MPNQLPVLIVDDEEQSRSLIRKLLSDSFPSLLIEEAENIATAMDKIKKHDPKLVFLDIQMRGETAFDLLDRVVDRRFEIIFTTAHSEFAIKAFRYSAIDYLMKPLDTDEFLSAIQKVIQRILQQQTSSPEQIDILKNIVSTKNKFPDKLTIPTLDGFLFITVRDILYCRAINNYTEFHLTTDEKLVSSHTLGYYDELLSARDFFRVHRSYLVNLAHIKMYKRGDGGTIIMSDGEEIEVSRNKKETFLKLFKE